MVSVLATGDEKKPSVGVPALTIGDGVLETNVLVTTGDEMTSVELPIETVSLTIADGEMGGNVVAIESAVILLLVVMSNVLIGDKVLITALAVVETASVIDVTTIQSTKLVIIAYMLIKTNTKIL